MGSVIQFGKIFDIKKSQTNETMPNRKLFYALLPLLYRKVFKNRHIKIPFYITKSDNFENGDGLLSLLFKSNKRFICSIRVR